MSIIRRCCLGCGHVYTGGVNCPVCPEVGQPLSGRPKKGRAQWKAMVNPSWSLDARMARLFPGVKDRGDLLLAAVEELERIKGVGTLMDVFRDDPLDDAPIAC